MSSQERSCQLQDLSSQLTNLKQILQCPKLYLSEAFSALTAQIDTEVMKLLETKTEVTTKKQQFEFNKIQSNWESMINYINEFQNECLAAFPGDQFQSETTNQIENDIKDIEAQLEDLNDIDKSIVSESDEHSQDLEFFDAKVDEVESLIYAATYELQRILHLNRSVFFLEKELFEAYVDERFIETFFGKLIHITDGFFSTRGIANIKDSDLGTDEMEFKKHTNEYLKTYYFIKQKRSYLTGQFFSEICLNCENEICMNLYNKNLEFVSVDLLRGFSNLAYIDMTRNSLKELPAKVFHGLVHLNVLNLGGNQLENLSAENFTGIPNLTSLNIACNNLNTINSTIFKYLPNLSHINMSFNHLESFCPNLFHGLHQLKEISLTTNNLTSIDPGVFQGLIELKKVNLAYNQIESIDPAIFRGLISLDMANLSFNKFWIPPAIGSSYFTGVRDDCRFYLNEEKEPERVYYFEDLDGINLELAFE